MTDSYDKWGINRTDDSQARDSRQTISASQKTIDLLI